MEERVLDKNDFQSQAVVICEDDSYSDEDLTVIVSKTKKSKPTQIEYPIVPLDFIRAPIFAAKPQVASRSVYVKGKTYVIGGFQPISEDRPPCPALDIRHGRALFTLLSYVNNYDKNPVIRFSIRDFCRRYASDNWNGRYARDIRGILSDLERCWFKVTHEAGHSDSYRIIKSISVRQKEPRKKPLVDDGQMEIWLDEVELHPEFFSMLSDYLSAAQINLKALTQIKSHLAQAIYVYIPSRAIHHSENNPFEITLTNLLEQLGHDIPKTKSERKKIFNQNKKSILSQLDHVELIDSMLRAKLVETSDQKDYKIQFWIQKNSKESDGVRDKKETGVLQKLWIKKGKKLEDFHNKTKQPLPNLSYYQEELMTKGKIVTKGNEIFFRYALALLGPIKFNELLSEAKSAVMEGQKINKTPTMRLIHYIKESI